MGVWDALGQGVGDAVDIWLERRRQKQEGARDWEELQMAKDIRAQGEQEKRVGNYGKLSDFSDPSKGIFVYEWQELSPGAYVPISREEQMRQYQEQLAQWEEKEATKSQTEYNREYALAQVRARPGADQKTPDDTQTLLQQLYGKDGRLNTAIATSLFTRMLQAQLPPGLPINPVDMLRGEAGVKRAQDIATYLGSAASSYHPGRPVQQDLLTFLAQMSPDLANFLNPPPPPPPRPAPVRAPEWSGGPPAMNELQLPPGYQVTGQAPAATPGTPGQAIEVKDARGRTMYWDALSGAWLYKE